MSLWLSDIQLRELTGYVQPAAQVRWLQKYGVHHTVSADGRPKVLPSSLERPSAPKRPQPNFAAVSSGR